MSTHQRLTAGVFMHRLVCKVLEHGFLCKLAHGSSRCPSLGIGWGPVLRGEGLLAIDTNLDTGFLVILEEGRRIVVEARDEGFLVVDVGMMSLASLHNLDG